MITSLNRSKKSKRSTGQESENCQIHGAAGHGHSEGPNDWSPRTEFPHQITPTGFPVSKWECNSELKKITPYTNVNYTRVVLNKGKGEGEKEGEREGEGRLSVWERYM